eukprot:378251_1
MLQFKQFTLQMWNDLVEECDILLKTDKIQSIASNGNHLDVYGIKEQLSMQKQHLYSVKLYTDYSELCKIFCGAFRLRKIWDNQYERISSVQRRNEKIANWSKLLIESVQCYGTFLTNNKMKYYRGIGMEFIFKRFITKFNVPMSTTTNFNSAVSFTEQCEGLILELKQYNEFLSGFDCSALSVFDHEQEVLFFGSDALLQIRCVYGIHNRKWTSYRRYIDGIQCILNIANGTIKWRRRNTIKEIIAFILPHLYFVEKQLSPYIILLLNYHLRHLPNIIEYEFRELSQQFSWVKHIFVKSKNIPNIANACNLFKTCNQIKIIMPNDCTMNDVACQSIVEDMLDIENHNVSIQLQWTLPKSMKNIQTTFNQIDKQNVYLTLKTDINELNNSITICHSVSEDFKSIKPQHNIKTQYGWETDETSYFRIIKHTDPTTRDIVFGFIRDIQALLSKNIIVPSEIVYMCLLYFYNVEYFTTHGSDMSIHDNGQIVKHHATGYYYDADVNDGNTVYGNLEINPNDYIKCIWIFKMIKLSTDAMIAIGLASTQANTESCFHGCWVNAADAEWVRSEPEEDCVNVSYAYQKCDNDILFITSIDGFQADSDKDYGNSDLNEGDEIKMELDIQNRTLKYYVNSKDQGMADDNLWFGANKTLMMAVSINTPSEIQLTDFKATYNVGDTN